MPDSEQDIMSTKYKADMPLRDFCSAKERNIINSVLNNLKGIGCYVDLDLFNGGKDPTITINGQTNATRPGYETPWPTLEQLAFGYQWDGSSIVTILAGNVRLHGDVNIAVAQINVTLASNPTWIYVQHTRGSSSASIAQSASEPTSTSVDLRVPLYKWVLIDGAYGLERILHLGDINLDIPLT